MVTAREFAAFLKIVDAEIVQITGVEHDYRAFIEDEVTEPAGGIELDWKQTREPEPVISCSPREVGARGSLHVEAPAEEWRINQTVDDGNLFTELRLPESDRGVTASVSVYGPPARYSGGGLDIDGDDEDYLIQAVVRTISETGLMDETDD